MECEKLARKDDPKPIRDWERGREWEGERERERESGRRKGAEETDDRDEQRVTRE